MNNSLYKFLEVSILAGGFFFIWYLTSEKRLKRKKKIIKENILLILRHLCLEIYKILNETSKTSKNVYDMLKDQPNASIELSKLEEVLLNNGCKKKIEDTEKEVLNKFNLSVEDFYDELKNYEKDADIQKSLKSIKKMYNESLLGLQPKLPSIDENISEDIIINLTSMIYKEKRKVYKSEINSMIKKNENLNVDTFSNAEFFEKLQKSTEHVEEKVIKENINLIPNLFTFKYLVNYYSNNESFLQKKKYLESKHGEKMIKILKIKKNKKKKKVTKDSSNNSLRSTPSFTSLGDNQNSDRSVITSQININKLESKENLDKINELEDKHNIEDQICNSEKIKNEKDTNEIEIKKILNEVQYENEAKNNENLLNKDANENKENENITENEDIIKNKKIEDQNIVENENINKKENEDIIVNEGIVENESINKKENEDIVENESINKKENEDIVENENINKKENEDIIENENINKKENEDIIENEDIVEKESINKKENEDIVEKESINKKENEDIVENENINKKEESEDKIIQNISHDINGNPNNIKGTTNDEVLNENNKEKSYIHEKEKEFDKTECELKDEHNKIKNNFEMKDDIEITSSLEHSCDKEESHENDLPYIKGQEKNENLGQNNLESKKDIPIKSNGKKKKWKRK
ncbi:conserved Plasmodium protein, unknown function [Plasmodium relictum]|uniref:Uncharacterized protein n=1 Tax=Plasmodium relictum TaxID=85471 RepID=A0A1J1HCI5_PLARL|nr:conserved Plasmodium protein, unknown function [Plasmodium relictum]CRH02806.1 conserved Plasmodium protein, unknown function [Plasmodium relictum]